MSAALGLWEGPRLADAEPDQGDHPPYDEDSMIPALAAPAMPLPSAPPAAESAFNPAVQDVEGLRAGFGAMQQDLARAMTEMQSRGNHLRSELSGLALPTSLQTTSVAAGPTRPTTASAAAPAAAEPARPPALGILFDAFEFAIQSEVLSKAAMAFTGSVSALTKGQ